MPRAAQLLGELSLKFKNAHGYWPPAHPRWEPHFSKPRRAQKSAHDREVREWREFLKGEYSGFNPNGCSCSPDYGVILRPVCDFHDLLYHLGGSLHDKQDSDVWFRDAILERSRFAFGPLDRVWFRYIIWSRYTAVSKVGRWLGFGGKFQRRFDDNRNR